MFYVDHDRPSGIVVYPRRAKPNSNYRGFVEAAIAMSANSNFRFVGVGLQPAEHELIEVFGKDKVAKVELTGQLDRTEMANLLRSADVVVSPTFWDGTPVSVLEAVACGAKVIAGELPELLLLQKSGLDIELIDAASTTAIAEAITRALNAANRFGDASSLPQPFDRKANETRVSEFYASVIEGHQRLSGRKYPQ
jgi:glycosyltransferase involved in cell wall biosynthesis